MDRIRKLTALVVLALLCIAGCGGEVINIQFTSMTPCSVYRDPIEQPPHTQIVAWHPDGSAVFFSTGAPAAAIYRVDADGSHLARVARTGPPQVGSVGPATTFSLSPAGWHLIYATCTYRIASREEWGAPPFYLYEPELARVSTDGTRHSRLTANEVVDGYPAWSPDGTRIAFLSNRRASSRLYLHTMGVDGSDVQFLNDPAWLSTPAAAQHPPQWSPDGRRLAFVGSDGLRRLAIYATDADGTDRKRVTEAVSGPSWSPDGQRLAFAKPDGDEIALYTIAADGTDAQRVKTITGWHPQLGEPGFRDPDPDPMRAWIETVAWSPDGSKILYTCGSIICVVTPEGSLVSWQPLSGKFAAWSPDGTRIALVSTGRPNFLGQYDMTVYTAAPDGSDVKVVAQAGVGYEPVAVR